MSEFKRITDKNLKGAVGKAIGDVPLPVDLKIGRAGADAQLASCKKEQDWLKKKILIVISDFEDELAKDEGLSPLDLSDRIKSILGGSEEFDPQAALIGRFIELGWITPEEREQERRAIGEWLDGLDKKKVGTLYLGVSDNEAFKRGLAALKQGTLPEGMVK
jgi:hypothetical protein